MSAALQLPVLWGTQHGSSALQPRLLDAGALPICERLPDALHAVEPLSPEKRVVSYAFYRKHTEKLLRRYVYASTQVGRSPNLLGEPVDRGWVSSRRVRTFEDALIFVLDVERCLNRLGAFDRTIVNRILLQEYTYTEAADLLGISTRTICMKLPLAIDRLTESLVEADLLVLPE